MGNFNAIRCLDVSLGDKLEQYAARLKDANPAIANAYGDLVERLERAGAGSEALAIGDHLPPFALPDSNGHIRRLEEFLKKGPLVVSFNRGHWCSFCRLELLALNEIAPAIAARGGGLVSIMPDIAALSDALKTRCDLDFPLLTDIDNGYALGANLMIALGPAVSVLLRKGGSDLARFQGNDAWFVPIPATYVVAPDGRISAAHVDADFRKRMAPADILKALDRLR